MWAVYRPLLPVSRPGLTAACSGVQRPANFTRLGHEFIIGLRPGSVVRGRAPRMAKRREGGPFDSENIAVPDAVASAAVRAVAWTGGRVHRSFPGQSADHELCRRHLTARCGVPKRHRE